MSFEKDSNSEPVNIAIKIELDADPEIDLIPQIQMQQFKMEEPLDLDDGNQVVIKNEPYIDESDETDERKVYPKTMIVFKVAEIDTIKTEIDFDEPLTVTANVERKIVRKKRTKRSKMKIKIKQKPAKRRRKYKIVPGGRIYECYLCKLSRLKLYRTQLELHMLKKHTEGTQYKCSNCEQTFSQMNQLKDHKTLSHSHQYPHQCPYCQRSFEKFDKMKLHGVVCKKERKIECYLCRYTRTTLAPSDLKRHMRLHTGEQKFRCKYCPKRFARKENLNRHMKNHADGLPHHCSNCLRKFAKVKEMRIHEKNCKIRRYECYLCKYTKSYLYPATLKAHIQKNHAG